MAIDHFHVQSYLNRGIFSIPDIERLFHGIMAINILAMMKKIQDQAAASPIVLGEYEIQLDGRRIAYVLKRSRRARLIWLKIQRESGLTVTVPHTYNVRYIGEYLQSHSDWILRNLARQNEKKPVPASNDSLPANTISYLGQCCTVVKNINGLGLIPLAEDKDRPADQFSEKISPAEIELWLRSQAALVINDKVKLFSQKMSLTYNRVSIRNQKARWASCSCRKNLNFNWRLIMVPEPVLEYVIIHELCHLKEMSHSRVFWELVASYCPGWREHRQWLDKHCYELNSQLGA
jgi:predicted metal-dependent hydrolase